MKNNLYKYIFPFLIGFFVAVVIFAIFYCIGFTPRNILSTVSPDLENRLDSGKYKFVNPLLERAYGNEEESLKWFPAERKLKTTLEDIIYEDSDMNVAVFFLNLKNSGWFSINAADTFIPASLLKLPMLISYYKLNEDEVGLLDQKITYQGADYNNLRKVGNLGNGTIKPGATYTVKELMKEMIVNSDNNALQLLYKYRQDSLTSVFSDMKISLPKTDTEISEKDFVTVRDIGRFLLVLYNASYLSAKDSEEALKILSQSSFKDGLVAGVPKNILVSHKFGERELEEENKNLKTELHDCGIVYHPQIPYIVCVMTKGKDINLQKLKIQKISKAIYDGVDSFSSK